MTSFHALPPASPQGASVRFIEDKRVDWERLRELLSASESVNHWANFGPVSRRLEAHLHRQLTLPSHARVISSASCTTVLEALSQTVYYVLGYKPRWVVSAFGFFSTLRGAFAEATVIDCDANGFLSLDALAQLPPDQYDGIVFTNVFGLANTIAPYRDFAETNGKFLLVDNAAGLTAFPARDVTPSVLEAVSFHHTKPHGFGEGGCAILHQDLEPVLRAVLNYGVGLDTNADRLGLNGKLSDPAAAFILQRLEARPVWAPAYVEQANRVLALGENAGLQALCPEAIMCLSVPGHLPFLGASPIPRDALPEQPIVFRKYYRPHDPCCKRAAELYARILNVPCHPDVARLGDEALLEAFSMACAQAA